MKDKLRELAAEWLRKGEFSKNSGAPRCGGQMIEDAAELLAILDAEGDGGAVVPMFDLDAMAWEQIKKAVHESEWMPPEYMANDWHFDVCEYLRKGAPTHPARSGVVSDEDVNYFLDRYEGKRAHSRSLVHIANARSCLEHFAKGERYER